VYYYDKLNLMHLQELKAAGSNQVAVCIKDSCSMCKIQLICITNQNLLLIVIAMTVIKCPHFER